MFRKFSFQKKLYLSCFAFNLLLLVICLAFFYYYTTDSLKQNMESTLISNTSVLLHDLDNLLTSADTTLKDLQLDSDLLAYVKEISETSPNYFSSHVPVKDSFLKKFRSVFLSNEMASTLSFVSLYYDNVGFSYLDGALELYNNALLVENETIVSLVEDSFYVRYLAPHTDYWKSDRIVFSVARSMQDMYNKYGVFIQDFELSCLSDLLEDFENPEDYIITILDENGNYCCSTSDEINEEQLLRAYQNAMENSEEKTFSVNDVTLSCYQTSTLTSWTFVLTTNIADYLSSMQQLLMISAILFFSLFLVMAVFLYMVTHQLARPLRALTEKLKNTEPGTDITLELASDNNEITMLTNAVQGFLQDINEKNRLLTESRQRTMKAHYDAMEAQLNPHFLYNTLTVIGMTGMSTGNMIVPKMCSELAALLRYSLSYSGQAVLLEQEIENIRGYLYIMNMRYEDGLVCEWELDASLNQIQVPKRILQPLVENCFQHGFKGKGVELPTPWRIRVSSVKTEDHWYLTIANNGIPFDRNKLEQIRAGIADFRTRPYDEISLRNIKTAGGFGLENTILRLSLFYQGKDFFDVSTKEETWTAITIGGPHHQVNE